MTEVIEVTDLGFTSNGKRLYHVHAGDVTATTTTVNIPCMQILAIVPSGTAATPHTFAGNALAIKGASHDTHDILVVGA